jgi:PAS domain S-box-containing protein
MGRRCLEKRAYGIASLVGTRARCSKNALGLAARALWLAKLANRSGQETEHGLVNQAASDLVIAEQVRAEQVRTLYAQSAPVLLANVLNAVIVSVVLWAHTSHALLLGWTSAMTLMALVRIEMRQRYWSRPRDPDEQVRWGTRFTIGSLTAGLMWGFAGGVLLPSSLPQQLVIVFVLGGMAAGAAASISCFMRAYYAYLIPSLLPTAARLLWFGGSEQLAMVAMLVLFMGALTLVARNVNRALSQAFQLRFENAELFAQVSRAQASLVEANDGLQRSNERLETRVRERTEELQASQEQLSEIVSESPDGIVVLDESGRVVSVNPAAERIAGRAAARLIGKHFAATEVLGAAEMSRAIDTFVGLVDGGERNSEELRIVRPDGQIVMVEVRLRVVRGGFDGKRRVHTVIRDVTERHRMQRLKDAYESRVREAERLESVSMLAGGVAHDFNNMLTMILGNVDRMELGELLSPKAKTLLGEIRHGSLQAANLTKQLLAFSRQQLLDVQPTDLAHVVGNARTVFERAVGEQNLLAISLPAEQLVVLVDATQLEQAILNLLVNARHALPEGGRVELEMRRVELDGDSAWPGAKPGPYVRIAVSDTGIGMDEATRSRVFEPFFTTRELGRGSGLGLSSVHGVIKQAGGDIRVTSEPGKGSRFEIILPCHASEPSRETHTADAVWSPGSGTVLLVEDQQRVRNSLQYILEDAGYRVIAAEDGERALELARANEGRIDLLVSDVIMPGVSGIELSRRLLALYPHLAVLLVSGFAGSEITLISELGDSVQFLQKPFDAASLTSAAQTALQRARATANREQAANLTN